MFLSFWSLDLMEIHKIMYVYYDMKMKRNFPGKQSQCEGERLKYRVGT